MGNLVHLAPGGAGALAHADGRAVCAAVAGSRAAYLLEQGFRDAAALAISPELRKALPVALDAASHRLMPTNPETVMVKLTPALALTAGAGMTGGARTEWLAAAADALKGIPADLLERGVRAARSTADHPSKIVPTILAEVRDLWRARLRERGAVKALADLATAGAAAAPEPERCTPAEAREIMKAHNLAVGNDPSRPAHVDGPSNIPPRKPTRADYLRLGVDPTVLDQIEAEAKATAAAHGRASTT